MVCGGYIFVTVHKVCHWVHCNNTNNDLNIKMIFYKFIMSVHLDSILFIFAIILHVSHYSVQCSPYDVYVQYTGVRTLLLNVLTRYRDQDGTSRGTPHHCRSLAYLLVIVAFNF